MSTKHHMGATDFSVLGQVGVDAETELSRYVKQAERQVLDADDYAGISKIADMAERAGWDEMTNACQSLLEEAQ